jgi:hypothetical protein
MAPNDRGRGMMPLYPNPKHGKRQWLVCKLVNKTEQLRIVCQDNWLGEYQTIKNWGQF